MRIVIIISKVDCVITINRVVCWTEICRMQLMQNDTRKKSRIILFGTIGIMIPVIIVAIAFFAVKSDAENKREYDRIRAEQAQRIAERKEKEAIQVVELSSNTKEVK